MKVVIAALALATVAQPAYAQLGALEKGIKRAKQVNDMVWTEEKERALGESVSAQLRTRFGVVQDPAVHKYVTLVGTVVAQQTSKPNLKWTFIVLDTDGVNAFASPGGFVHVTRGALALLQNEAELAGVLGHEIGHIVKQHTINAIRKSKAVEIGVEEGAAASETVLLDRFAQLAYTNIIENNFDRGDEMDADKEGVTAASKAGYAPNALSTFLTRLAERNKNMTQRNGMFASHPDLKARQDGVAKTIQTGNLKAAAAVEARYKQNITYPPVEVTLVPTATEGLAGLVGGSKPAAPTEEEKKKEQEAGQKKKGFGLGSLTKPFGGGGGEKQSAQVSASAGARGVAPDRDAKGGSNAALVAISLTAADIAEFKKGIA
ncbi:MAG TPA: M48 family metalloprotease [Vicinamibacterales bacterium]|nr:M48 family metalloprotease [Vicinamibacterales bacterium]